MKIFEINQIEEIKQFLQSAKSTFSDDLFKNVAEIINEVKSGGDQALIRYSNKFDKTNFTKAQDFIVSEEEILDAEKNISIEVYEALKTAYQRIYSYHQKQKPQDLIYQDEIGFELGNIWRSLDSVGIYAPGGSASYPSSVLMAAVPATVANVKEITLCSPANQGKINDVILVAAKICGINKIYKIGGAQAIAALAYGTTTINKVDKIVGPGNSYVAMAKKIVYGDVGIDSIAGPTDLTIICDDENNPSWIAADTLSQLEHGTDSKVFIITQNQNFAKKVLEEIQKLSQNLPRKNIIEQSLKNSFIFVINNFSLAPEIANLIAPEHLEISCQNAKNFVAKIKNAGAIFVGKYSAESIGDYIAGPSHVLPTEGTAKFSSGLSIYDFLKRISLMSCDEKTFLKLADKAAKLAEIEGLDAHKLSIEIRKK